MISDPLDDFEQWLNGNQTDWDNHANSLLRRYQRGTLRWATLDGRTPLVQEMESEHLQNLLNLIGRGGIGFPHPTMAATWVRILQQEQAFRREALSRQLSIF